MKIIKKDLKLKSKKDYFLKHLQIIVPYLPVDISPKEMEVLACFMTISDEDKRFSTEGRKKVKSMIDKLSDGGLGNFLRSLKDKGIILSQQDGTLYIHKALIPMGDGKQEYQFSIELSES